MINGADAATVLVCGIVRPLFKLYGVPPFGGMSRMIPMAVLFAIPAVRQASIAVIAFCKPAPVAA
jgi:hypothetical protein